ncbi:uncharacterized protein LOC123692606 [Colias croceus]|uniref:uncharacterized protein LOC123692606 n=1 Tax=Colias crocea TaxID=72248 RepID=UPI001E27F855|nr:uncharacterized protein LOC123692606 [Colias croceus]
MKVLVALYLKKKGIIVCAGNAIPSKPGDNSHYVEGESCYVWIPDGEGVPRLVDLEEPADKSFLNARNGANNAYWLFTSGVEVWSGIFGLTTGSKSPF